MRLCPWCLALASSIPVLGLERVCPRKGCPWPWSRIFFVSLALALSLVSSTPPLGVLIKRITVSHLRTVGLVGGQQLCEESKKLQTRIIFERNYSFFYYCLLSCRCVMLQKSILSKLKWRDTAPLTPSVATALCPRLEDSTIFEPLKLRITINRQLLLLIGS